jgi:Flp pilus assembly pilin Flp
MRQLNMTAEVRRLLAAREVTMAAEYAIIAAGVAVAAAITALGGQVVTLRQAVAGIFS